MRPSRILFLVALAIGNLPYACVYGIPIDSFNIPSETKCKGERTCKRNLTNTSSLGGTLGIEVQNVPAPAANTTSSTKALATLELRTGPKKGRVVWGSSGNPAGRLTLVWDGDPNAGQISGSGLGCLDLLADGATAFILEDLAYSASCDVGARKVTEGSAPGGECSPLVIESRIFNADDPTGQKYTTSVIRRHHRLSGQDLRIPFSTFTREGPNGGANPSCVGAISITLKADELTKSVVTFGPFSTNGSCTTDASCLRQGGTPSTQIEVEQSASPVASVTPQPITPPVVSASPTPTALPSPTAMHTPTSSPTPTVTLTSTIAVDNTVANTVSTDTDGTSSLTKDEKATRDVSVVPTTTPKPPVVTEEVIYGDFIER